MIRVSAFVLSCVMLWGSTVCASDLTLQVTDNENGILSLGYSSFTGNPPIGLALNISVNDPNVELTVQLQTPYYDLLRTFDPNDNEVNQITISLLSTLDAQTPFPGSLESIVDIRVGKTAQVTIDESADQGGVIDSAGQPIQVTNNFPLVVDVTKNQCETCVGDITGDNKIDNFDLSALITYIQANGVDPFYDIPLTESTICYDLTGDGVLVNIFDVSSMVSILQTYGTPPFFEIPCQPE